MTETCANSYHLDHLRKHGACPTCNATDDTPPAHITDRIEELRLQYAGSTNDFQVWLERRSTFDHLFIGVLIAEIKRLYEHDRVKADNLIMECAQFASKI